MVPQRLNVELFDTKVKQRDAIVRSNMKIFETPA